MQSKLVDALYLKYNPVAIIWADERPHADLEFDKNTSIWQGCLMSFFSEVLRKGKTALFDRQTIGCPNGFTSLGFGNQLHKFDFDQDCLAYDVTIGNANWEKGRAKAAELKEKNYPPVFIETFLEGEGMKKTPELANESFAQWPYTDIPAQYVVFKSLARAHPEKDNIVVITFAANTYQLSALTGLANFENPRNDNVIVPWITGACQALGMYPYRELNSPHPRAVIGLKELSPFDNKIGDDLLLFSVTRKLFDEMEKNVAASFLNRSSWLKLVEQKSQQWQS